MNKENKNTSESNDATYVKKPEIHYSYKFQPYVRDLGGSPYTLYNNAKTNVDYRRLWSLLNGTFKQGGKINMIEFLKNGSGIHIKEKNKGKFTSYCGGKVTDECIRKAKASGNPTLVKRATFA